MGQVLETLPQTIDPVTIVFNDVTNNQITMKWNDPPMSTLTGGSEVPILSYLIESAVGAGTFSPLVTLTFGTNSYTHSSLVAGTAYSYQIKAVNRYGDAPTFSTVTIMKTG